jgi:hypothetical protein
VKSVTGRAMICSPNQLRSQTKKGWAAQPVDHSRIEKSSGPDLAARIEPA